MGYKDSETNIIKVDYSPEINAINAKLSDQDAQTTTLLHGLNAITTSQTTATAVRLFGRTLVNLLGKDGNFEDKLWGVGSEVSTPTNDTTEYYLGTHSEKGTLNAIAGNRYFFNDRSNDKFIPGNYYLFSIYVRQSTVGDVVVSVRKNDATWTTVNSKAVLSMDANKWIRFDVKFQMWSTGEKVKLLVESTATDAKDMWIDAASIYEIPQAIYDKKDVDPAYTGNALADKFPYVDSVQHAMNPFIKTSGKNLIPPFTSGNWTLHANAKIIGDYELELENVTSTFEISAIEIPCLPNTTYTISIGSNDGRLVVETHDKDDNYLGNYNEMYNAGSYTFTTLSNASKIKVYLDNGNTTSGTYNFAEPQLELNDIETRFEPQNESYLYVAQDADKNPISLASNNDGTVADEVYQRDGQWYLISRFDKNVVVDGSKSWGSITDYTGFKRMCADFTNYDVKVSNGELTKYNGKPIVLDPDMGGNASPNGDVAFISGDSANNLYVYVFDIDSGWGETYTPSADEIKAYFYGFQMNNGTFGTAYDGTGTKTWVPIGDADNTRATTVLPAADAPTIVEGKIDHYKLTYQFAQATEEAIEVEGSLDLIDAGNQILLGEAVIVREKVTPVNYGSVYSYINDPTADGGSSSSLLNNKAADIIGVYKNGELDTNWKVETVTNGNGVHAITEQANFDPTAEYTVTYTASETYKLSSAENNVEVTYDTNIKTVVNALVQKQEDDETDISVLKLQMIDAIARLQAGGL